MTYQNLIQELKLLADIEFQEQVKKFFKTGKGHYSEHDKFIGIRVPDLRKLAKSFMQIDLKELEQLIDSNVNEQKLIALIILVEQYKKSDLNKRKKIIEFYLKNIRFVNNWNLVDQSAPYIMMDREILLPLATSNDLWERRIAIVGTLFFIRKGDFQLTVEIAKMLLQDKHDLIHKATGWMLREVGKRDENILLEFLDNHVLEMPRTMLRYAIEKFPQEKRKYYLEKR